jgi:hypothetical protein
MYAAASGAVDSETWGRCFNGPRYTAKTNPTSAKGMATVLFTVLCPALPHLVEKPGAHHLRKLYGVSQARKHH